MATITINGKRLDVEEGKKILDCALDAGIYIPHLCHHPDLNPLGSCRMCIVAVEGQEGVVTSCNLKAKDGMVIHTQSEAITKLRMLALELLLTGHPDDCSTCPKYGNCELQMLIQYIGPKTGRLKMRNKGFTPDERNPLIVHDMNRCILCGRCVRACNELRDVKVLQYQKKDMESYVGTLHNKLLMDDQCRFCGACVEVCPTGTIRDKYLASNPDMTREEAIVPCRTACPAHTDVPRYLRLAKEGKFDEATAVIREKVPFPIVLGMVCNHDCELHCKHKDLNQALSIRNIKRYVAEHDDGTLWRKNSKQMPQTDKKVCVVGGGPAGLTAAYYLRKQGHSVTVKEALPSVGGMLSYGIPSYRLPRDVVAGEAAVLEEVGVTIETGVRVEQPLTLLEEYDAVIMAIGGHRGVRLPIDGSELKGTLVNIDFLRNVALHQPTGMGKKVIVLGGGNVAFDCARTAKRLGAEEIHLACLESREKMTADDQEIKQAQEEGIFVHPAQTFERITGEEYVSGVDFCNVKSFTFDENHRAIVEKEPQSLHHIDADTVIFATGQRPDIDASAGLELGKGNTIVVDANTHQTKVRGMFACGDAIYGTKSVIMSIESGRETASEVDRFLGGDGDISEVLATVTTLNPCIGREEGFAQRQRFTSQMDGAKKRQDNFNAFDHGLCDDSICEEAGRCLQCDLRLQIRKTKTWADFSSDEVQKG